MSRECLKASFSVTESSADEGTFKGMASVFGTAVDTWCPTVIDPGAFRATLADEPQRKRVRVLWQHDERCPIGIPTEMVETAVGLEVNARISKTEKGNEALTLLRDGVITDLSIGFDPVTVRMEDRGPGVEPLRHVVEAKLWEFSLVTWGANAPAQVYQVNAMGKAPRHPWNAINHGIATLRERYAGKVLSSKNLRLVNDAIEALAALKAAAEKADAEDEAQSAAIAAEIQHKVNEVNSQIVSAQIEFAQATRVAA